jgi:hypothetical protein
MSSKFIDFIFVIPERVAELAHSIDK